jgi:hypothetical protein
MLRDEGTNCVNKLWPRASVSWCVVRSASNDRDAKARHELAKRLHIRHRRVIASDDGLNWNAQRRKLLTGHRQRRIRAANVGKGLSVLSGQRGRRTLTNLFVIWWRLIMRRVRQDQRPQCSFLSQSGFHRGIAPPVRANEGQLASHFATANHALVFMS